MIHIRFYSEVKVWQKNTYPYYRGLNFGCLHLIYYCGHKWNTWSTFAQWMLVGVSRYWFVYISYPRLLLSPEWLPFITCVPLQKTERPLNLIWLPAAYWDTGVLLCGRGFIYSLSTLICGMLFKHTGFDLVMETGTLSPLGCWIKLDNSEKQNRGYKVTTLKPPLQQVVDSLYMHYETIGKVNPICWH